MTTLVALAVLATQPQGLQASATLGAPAPTFALPSVEGKTISLDAYKGKFVVLEWTNKDCPFVVKHYQGGMQATQAEAKKMGAVWLSICSSAPGKQGYMEPAEYKGHIKATKILADSVLLDPDGKVGKMYNAKTTPQIVVIDPKGTMIYNGAIDNAQTANPTPKVNYALQALTEAMAGKEVSVATSRPYGCSVKYKD
jgi:peroxiredoxin